MAAHSTATNVDAQTPEAQAFLQANDENLQELATFVDFAGEKFTPCFVSVTFSGDRATIIEALRTHPSCQDVQFVVFRFDDPQLRFLRDELVKELPKVEREPGKKLVLLLTGLESSIGMVGDYPPMLADLNFVRDGFKTAVPHPVVIFLPDESLRRLAEFAPDFWAWRMAVVRFKSVAESVRSRVRQFVGQSDKINVALAQDTSHRALDSQIKRDIIPRLLMEYESGDLGQDEELKSFKSELMTDLGIVLYDDDNLNVAKDILKKTLAAGDFRESTLTKPQAYCYLGAIERRQSNYREALKLLNKSIEGFEQKRHSDYQKGLARAIANRGATYREIEQYSEALSDFKRAIELEPEDKWAIAQRGETYQLMERYPEAIADFNRAVEIDPEDEWAIAIRGETYQLMERYPEAIADFNLAIELDPEYQQVIAIRGETYRLMKCYAEAIADFNRAIELDSEDEWATASRGKTYQLMECYSEAIADLNRAIELDPEYKWAIAQRGITYRLIERYAEAIIDFNRAIELDPKYRDAIVIRGETYQVTGRYTEAITDFSRAIELAPEHMLLIANRGITYQFMGRYAEAITDLNRVIKLDPGCKGAIATRGKTHQLMERYSEAIADLNRAIELDPEYKEAIATRGETYRLMERYPEAITDFDRVIELDPECKWAIAQRGVTYQLMERYLEAITDFDKAIEIDSEYGWVIAHRGQVYYLIHEYQQALTDFDTAARLGNKNYWRVHKRGELNLLLGAQEEALRDFESSLKLKPENDWALYMRSLAHKTLNKTENATADIQQAITLAQQTYEADSQDSRNTFNLAIYHLVVGNPDKAKRLSQEAISKSTPNIYIKEAIRDLEDLLTVLPNFPTAGDLYSFLQTSLSQRTELTEQEGESQ